MVGYDNLSNKDRGSEEMADLCDNMGFEDSRHNLLVAVGDLVIFLIGYQIQLLSFFRQFLNSSESHRRSDLDVCRAQFVLRCGAATA